MLASAWAALVTSGGVDTPSLVFSAAAIVLRLLIVTGVVRFQLPDGVTTGFALAYAGFFPVDYYFLSRDFLISTLHLIFFLAALITLRARTPREYFLVKVIALTQLLAACVLSQGLVFLAFLTLFASFGIVAQISGEIRYNLTQPQTIARAGQKGVSLRILGVSSFVFVAVLLVGASLFVLLPRTAGIMFRGFPNDRLRRTGYTDEVRLNQVGELQFTTTPVLRARFQNSQRMPGLKWRGDALLQFDGVRWFNRRQDIDLLKPQNGQFPLTDFAYVWPRGPRVSYEVKLENVGGNELFFVGRPEVLRLDYPFPIFRTPTGQIRAGNLLGPGLRYQAYSFLPQPQLRNPPPADIPEELRNQALSLPPIDPRIPDLARDWTRTAGDDLARAQLIERRLRTSFQYSTRLLDRPVPDPMAHFLFTRKEGHCEYFASAMAVMLRTLGIPARLATGFQAGTYNPISGWHMVRGADAHTWVEAWLPEHGWLTFDPTPPDPRGASSALLAHLSLYLDAAEVFWQEWVLSYDLERQILLADRVGRGGRNFSIDWRRRWKSVEAWGKAVAAELPRIAIALTGSLVSVVLLLWLAPRVLAYWRHRRRTALLRSGQAAASDATILYQRMLELLRARRLEKPTWMTANEFAAKVPGDRAGALVRELTSAYQDLRFGHRPAAGARMLGLLEELEQELR